MLVWLSSSCIKIWIHSDQRNLSNQKQFHREIPRRSRAFERPVPRVPMKHYLKVRGAQRSFTFQHEFQTSWHISFARKDDEITSSYRLRRQSKIKVSKSGLETMRLRGPKELREHPYKKPWELREQLWPNRRPPLLYQS